MLNTPLFADNATVVIGDNYAYTFLGNDVLLEADLNVTAANSFAVNVQLWACTSPFEGGVLQGVKVAEASCGVLTENKKLSETVPAYAPAGQASYFMVLVLVSKPVNQPETVISYANFAQTQQFLLPRMLGKVSCDIQQEAAEVRIDAIENPRASTNLSGTLALELWSLSQKYNGASFNGVKQGGVLLGTLLGQNSWQNNVIHIHLASKPIVGEYVVLMLREWVGNGYITRDYFHLEQATSQNAVTPVSESVVTIVEPIEHPVMDWIEKVESVVEAVSPFVESVAHTMGSVVAAIVDVAEQIIEEAEKYSEPELAQQEAEVAKPAKKVPSRVLKSKVEPKEVLSLNVATEEQLTAVKGVSKAVAATLVACRPYAKWDEVGGVKGVGGKLLIKLKANFAL